MFCCIFFFSSRRRHTRYIGYWSSDVCSSDLTVVRLASIPHGTVALFQGTAVTANGGPNIAIKGIKPFGIGGPPTQKIGRASCRERVERAGADGALKRQHG